MVVILLRGAFAEFFDSISADAVTWVYDTFYGGGLVHGSEILHYLCAVTSECASLVWFYLPAIGVYWGLCRLMTKRGKQSGDSPRICRACGYLLHGLPHNRCPECGTVNNRTKHKADLAKPTWRRLFRATAMVWALFGAPLLLVTLTYDWLSMAAPVVQDRIIGVFLPLTDDLGHWASGYVVHCAECCVWVVAHVTVLIAVWEIALALSCRGRIPPPLRGGD